MGSEASWLFLGFSDNRVILTPKNSKGTTKSDRPFFSYSMVPTNLNNSEHRAAYQAAFDEMLAALPTNPDPAETWDAAFWNNLVRTQEIDMDYKLITNLFTKRLATTQKRLSPDQFDTLQDIYLYMAQRNNPANAAKVIDGLITSFEGERDQLLIRKAELLTYYLGDTETAKRGLTKLSQEMSEMGEWARIRLGDAAFVEGDLNLATKYYADVQNRARTRRNEKTDPGAPGSDWNVGMLLDVAKSEDVRSLISQDYLLEAMNALRKWEREFPLSKISGDFIINESQLYLELNDPARARPMLEAYCREVDASSFLPDAAKLLIECAKRMKGPPDEIHKIISSVKGRLEFHPVATELDAFLKGK